MRTGAVVLAGGAARRMAGIDTLAMLPAAVTVVDLGDDAVLNVNRPADLRRARAAVAATGDG